MSGCDPCFLSFPFSYKSSHTGQDTDTKLKICVKQNVKHLITYILFISALFLLPLNNFGQLVLYDELLEKLDQTLTQQ